MGNEQVVEIGTESDIVLVRRAVRRYAQAVGLSLIDSTKLVTAASEIARNTLTHGGGGLARVSHVENDGRTGVRVAFEDEGPGIEDVNRALEDYFTTGEGLGLGLGGARRLVNEFEIDSAPGEGTRITLTRWRA